MKPRWQTPKPPGVTGTYGTRAIAWAQSELGLTPGPWQAKVIRDLLRHDKHGDLVHRIGLVSTARQNGKSVIVRIIVGWLLDEGIFLPPFRGWSDIRAAAHDAKQARIIYRYLWQDLAGIPRIEKDDTFRLSEWRGLRHGDVLFDTVTGQPGSSRGLSAGLIAWDEMLTQRDWDMWEAISPTQSAQRSPLMILTSTAGTVESVVLRRFYDRLVAISTGDQPPDPSFYGAWWQSDSPEAGLDWRQLAQANPGLVDGRLSKAAITVEHGILPPDSWRRERLNHWVDTVAPGAFAPGVWAACRVPDPLAGVPERGPFALGVDVQPGWERATISVAGIREDGRVAAVVWKDFREDITAQKLIDAVQAFPDIENVMMVGYDQAMAAAPAFAREVEHGSYIPWTAHKPHEVTQACMDVAEMIVSQRLAHDDRLLDAQIPGTARRDVGQDGAFRFSRAASTGPIDAVMAMTFAAHSIAFMGGYPSIT